MIPISDTAPRYRFPIWVPLLILANAAVYVAQMIHEEQALWMFDRFAVQPADLFAKWRAVIDDPGLLRTGLKDFLFVAVMPLITYQFLHSGPLHLLGNLLFLWVFGDNVEGRLGRLRFLVFYLLSGVVAVLVHCWMEPTSTRSVVGASGAISGVLGAYLLLFASSRIRLLVPIFFLVTMVELPAWFVLIVWFVLQIPDVQGVLGWLQVGGVAWWAHVGGFVAGIVTLPVFVVLNPLPERSKA